MGGVVILIYKLGTLGTEKFSNLSKAHSGGMMSAEHRLLRKCHRKEWSELRVRVVGSQPGKFLMLLNLLWVQEPFENMLKAYNLSPEKCVHVLSQKKIPI